jgi:hypothetical protein
MYINSLVTILKVVTKPAHCVYSISQPPFATTLYWKQGGQVGVTVVVGVIVFVGVVVGV